ncbi:uncharacterized protein Z519_01545 [Cladophialophora bantiana CBS 173.52]|uniref:NAD(P)-binding protein n=1 Tax=Cladophialophora bantiana (strain ATCC 10958 / CBS 173.52 / CDC B-1940 / NIH 8579) TaxID=1442370 RepID=A0A0D2F797_CLAB1|nr:uncharacterized protein Z519_01545 [Cladophialophora bantiana CBS 173.52]KIW97961.1 hypothetical protein Z519_01545 [Cladophialophora bantiana CBS 173.52]
MASQNLNRLAGKVALITGGASGIGLAVAQTFLTEGAKVLVVDYSAANIESARSLLSSQGLASDIVKFHQADASDEESVIAFVDKCVQDFGSLDIAVLNAGIGTQFFISDLTAAEYDRMMRINARGPFLGVKYSAQKMKSLGVGGSIICTASIASLVAHPGVCAYSMAKFAVRALMITAAQEFARDKIRVNAVSPGYVRTSMINVFEDLEARLEATPAGRAAEPMEVAKVFLFLASDEASMVSGSNYRVDGGWVNH